jgi:GNAT superfamily N-acetyltransferase
MTELGTERRSTISSTARAISGTAEVAQPTSGGMEIRRALQADAAAIRELTRRSYAKWVPVIGREPTPMVADYDRAVRDHMIDLLFVGTELVGLIETVGKGDHLMIENVAVSPAFQGRGHGRFLLDHAERLAASLRLPELRLFTNTRFVTNVEFYGRRGYAIDRVEPFKGGFIVHMSKRIATA